MKFEWDKEKEKEKINILKHKISFEQAAYVFSDPYALNKYDKNHSENEARWLLLGKSLKEVLLLVVHTFRTDDSIETVRIISARKATKFEQQVYRSRYPK